MDTANHYIKAGHNNLHNLVTPGFDDFAPLHLKMSLSHMWTPRMWA